MELYPYCLLLWARLIANKIKKTFIPGRVCGVAPKAENLRLEKK